MAYSWYAVCMCMYVCVCMCVYVCVCMYVYMMCACVCVLTYFTYFHMYFQCFPITVMQAVRILISELPQCHWLQSLPLRLLLHLFLHLLVQYLWLQ